MLWTCLSVIVAHPRSRYSIDLFIKIINFINDDCKLYLCYINYDTYMSWSVPMVFDEFNYW